MLQEKDIAIELKCQQYICKTYMRNEEETQSVLLFESKQETGEVKCPYCGGMVHICDSASKRLRDMPIWTESRQDICFVCHRYRCVACGRKHTEDIPLQYPGTRITVRAANWIKSMLMNKITIKSIQEITGIHWETIRNIHIGMMDTTLKEHTEELIAAGYRPQYLAVDEFAIHKGHTYATCVMDLESGEVLWVGKGRRKEDFEAFFREIEPSFLTDIKAVAMDMNASYHILVQQHLPQAQIVYDRYHMQAQYGKEVLGAVRLDAANKHKDVSQELYSRVDEASKENSRQIKEQIRAEKKKYSQIKKLRWTLLTNGENLSEKQASTLQDILETHSDLAVCYAMKEEMISLFQLRDLSEAELGWRKWFSAAKESEIPALVRFAELKEKRLDGLVAHALYPISTGKLEGFNNKIKVAKRVAYGFRDEHYFFSLIRFIALSPNFP